MRAGNADHVGHIVGQNGLGLGDIAVLARRHNHRRRENVAQHRAKPLGDGSEGADGKAHVRHLRRDGVTAVIGRMRDVDEVDLGRVDELRNDPTHIIDGQTAGEELIATNANADHDVFPDGGAHGAQHLLGKAYAVGFAAAVGIVALVAGGRHELLQQMPVCHLDFDTGKAGFNKISGDIDVGLDHLFDLGDRHRVRWRRGG